jgi:hypothetical protein
MSREYCGWTRRGRGPWRFFCRAFSEQVVLDTLLRDAPPGTVKLVKEGSDDPNGTMRGFRQPPRRRF